MEGRVRVRRLCRFEQRRGQCRSRSPAFVLPQDGAQRLARDIEAPAFIAEYVTPAAGPRAFARWFSP